MGADRCHRRRRRRGSNSSSGGSSGNCGVRVSSGDQRGGVRPASVSLCCAVAYSLTTTTCVHAASEDLLETAFCVPDQDGPGEWACAEAGWTPGVIERDLGVAQRLDGSEDEKDQIRYVIEDMEQYYDTEVPLMPQSVRSRW